MSFSIWIEAFCCIIIHLMERRGYANMVYILLSVFKIQVRGRLPWSLSPSLYLSPQHFASFVVVFVLHCKALVNARVYSTYDIALRILYVLPLLRAIIHTKRESAQFHFWIIACFSRYVSMETINAFYIQFQFYYRPFVIRPNASKHLNPSSSLSPLLYIRIFEHSTDGKRVYVHWELEGITLAKWPNSILSSMQINRWKLLRKIYILRQKINEK